MVFGLTDIFELSFVQISPMNDFEFKKSKPELGHKTGSK